MKLAHTLLKEIKAEEEHHWSSKEDHRGLVTERATVDWWLSERKSNRLDWTQFDWIPSRKRTHSPTSMDVSQKPFPVAPAIRSTVLRLLSWHDACFLL